MNDINSENLEETFTGDDGRWRVNLSVFEGPLDLLYHLIKKNEVDIYDIPIAEIADQYLAAVELMKELNMDVAGEFLVMAATLMQIKSKMLLPRHEEIEGLEEDPRLMIVRPLEEYIKIKEAAKKIAQRPLLDDMVFARAPDPDETTVARGEEIIAAGLFELMDAFAKLLSRSREAEVVTLTAETVSVRERMVELMDLLALHQTLSFDELFDSLPTRTDLVVTFLAILEMAKISAVRIVQHVQTGLIRLFPQGP